MHSVFHNAIPRYSPSGTRVCENMPLHATIILMLHYLYLHGILVFLSAFTCAIHDAQYVH